MIGPFVFVQIENPEARDELVLDGAEGDDLVSTSSAAMKMTLARRRGNRRAASAGPATTCSRAARTSTTCQGRGGDDTASLGGDFDRFTWNPGDGNDVVDGGPSHDSITFNGSAAAERVSLSADGRRYTGHARHRLGRSPISAASRS